MIEFRIGFEELTIEFVLLLIFGDDGFDVLFLILHSF